MHAPPDAIAVVGIAGRFPGARNPEELWQLTRANSCVVTRRIDSNGRLMLARGLLESFEDFAPDFFGISQREAITLDPQHRLLLECAWEALTDTDPGWRADGRSRKTAVFLGVNHSGYRDLLCQTIPRVSALEFESGTDKDFVATRIAYRLGLEGPSLSVQSACSTSLVAVHLACQSLLEFDSDQAIAGGASIVLPHSIGYRYEPQSIHSADGVCRPFDADANGTVMGDGAGVVVLRRLEDAIEDGSRIYAVIRGSAINNDGARKAGYAAPSAAGQEEVIRTALARAGFMPSEIGYVETHGTGTPLGDRIEFRALKNIFAESGASCTLGSVKGAIGHLDTAAGVVGLIRCCFAVQRGLLPGTVNHVTPPPDINFDLTPFSILREARSWESEAIRKAGVSSFGVGGTNAHIVLEEYRGAATRYGNWEALRNAGYRPKRVWPEQVSPEGSTQGQGLRREIEHRRAVWHELLVDDARSGHPEYGQIILIGNRDIASETIRRQLRAYGCATTLTDTFNDSLLESGSRNLVVCTFALSDDTIQRWRAYDTLSAMARRWFKGSSGAGLDVILVTREAFSVLGDERGDPALAALSGLARVLTMEAPYVRIRAIDVQNTSPLSLARLSQESVVWRAEPLVVQRGRRSWRLHYEPFTVSVDQPFSPWGQSVSVVIGTGNLGGVVAKALASAGHQIVLIARPGSTEGASRLADQLMCSHERVAIEECDVGNPRDVSALLESIANRYGAIDQLVHAAGISGEAAYQSSGHLPFWQDEKHFRVKIDGIAALAEAVERYSIRRVVLMSSLAGTIGALSLGPYSAAAAAMDSYAERFNGPKTLWLSVGWDAWWQPVPLTAREARMVNEGISPDEGYGLMVALLTSGLSGHVIVSNGDFSARWDRFILHPLQNATEPPAAADNADDSSTGILQMLINSWRTCLSAPEVSADVKLSSLGADSLTWVEVLCDVEAKLGRKLPEDLFFGAATPRLLAERISESLAGFSSIRTPRESVLAWGDDGPVVWCLHPIGGSPDAFSELAKTLCNCQVRAVVGLPLADVTEDESVESVAERYFELLGVDSPSVIVGWSFGGVIAFHLAQLVRAATGLVPPVLVLDMPAPMGASTRSIIDVSDAEILATIVSHRAREAGRSPSVTGWEHVADDDALAAFIHRLRGGLLPEGFTVAIGKRMAAGYRRRLAAVERYRPSSYSGRVVLIAASETEFGDTGLLRGVISSPIDDPTWGWQSLSSETVAVNMIEGHHMTLLQQPAVYDLADIIRQWSHT
jgi:3-oxoacyl-(acyl-carrier-protein) synthase/thioesterase domain-containing protein